MSRPVLLFYLVSLPAPTIALDRGPEVSVGPQGPPMRIRCTAPSSYLEGMFSLYREGQNSPVQELSAPESKHGVTFTLEGAADGGGYQCGYSAWVSGQLRRSELSPVVLLMVTEYTVPASPASQGNDTTETAPAWILPVSVGAAAALLLFIAVVVVVAVKRVRAAKKQKQREKESCWTPNTDISTTDLAFSNSLFEDQMKLDAQELPGPPDLTGLSDTDPAARKHLPSGTHFSTFRTCT